MNISKDYITETTDINHVAYLIAVGGYSIGDIHHKTNERNGRPILSFVFYENQSAIDGQIRDYINSDVSKFMRVKNELLSLIRQSSGKSREEFLEEANQI